ncbi:MAG: DUF3592 domain-containing protein, partial [Capsulimonas sp.]|uniref:DUF3592 domain-containing protein n=1 Tax=Capsulimonas sp. TaxID=2494211 RepID=UPI0032678468
ADASPPPAGVVIPQFGRPVTADVLETPSPPMGAAAPPGMASPGTPANAYDATPFSPPADTGTKIAVGVGIGVLVLMLLGRLLNPIRLLFIALGVGVIFLGHYLGHRSAAFRKTAIQATGRVVRLDQSGSGGDSYYYSVVDFTTYEGVPTEFRDTQGSRPPQNHVGDTVKVYYNPLAPTDAQIDSSLSQWLPIGMYVFGALMILGAVAGNPTRVGGGDMTDAF